MPSLFGRPGVRLVMLLTVVAAAALTVLIVTGIFERDGGSSTGTAAASLVDASRPEARRALQQAKQQRERLTSPQAKGDRRRSGIRYRKLGAGRALRVGRQMHRAVLRDRTPRPLAAARKRGMVVARYPSAYAAVLRPRKGAGDEKLGVMAMSTLPMRSQDSTGQTRLVDLSLRRRSDGFVPDNARTKLWIGDRVSDGFRVSDSEIGVVPLDVAEQTAGTRSGDAVFFANSGKDADHIVRVTPAGAESLVQLRSTDSPERFRYRIDLPADGALREQSDGSIAFTRGGRRVGMITKPTAWDADQRAIEVKTTLRGNLLTLDVSHRGRDIRYPAMVDPNYIDLLQYRWYRGGANSATNQYWSYVTNQPSLMGGVFGNYQNGAFGQTNGLYSASRGGQVFPAGTYGYWRFTAPGTTSVLQAEWVRLSHIFTYAGGPPPCIDYGLIYNTTAWRTHGVECANFYPDYRLSCWDCEDRDGYSYDPAVTGAQFGTGIYAATIANFSDYLGESTIYLADPDDPTVTITDQPATAWTTTPAGTIAANASDPGLGVESIDITGAGTTYNSGCLQGGPCPNTMSRSASVASLNLPDGNNTVAVTARDASYYAYRDANGNIVPGKHQSSATAPVKLDRQPPEIALSGTLSDARNGFIGPGQTVTLQAVATDGALTPATAQRSGATSVTATLDGQPMTNSPVAAPCTQAEGSCTLTLNTNLSAAQLDELEPGDHTVVVTATDTLGQSASETLTFGFDNAPPLIELDNSLADYDGEVLTESSYRLIAQALDTDAELYGAGLRDVVVRLDGQVVSTTAAACVPETTCEQSRAWDWDTTSAANGSHEITITAADRADNQTVETIEIELQRVPDQPQQTSATVRRTIIGASLGDRAGSSTAAVGDVNGDGLADYLVGAPGVSASGRTANGAAYLVLGDTAGGTVDLANPGPAVRRILGPGNNSACGASVAAGGDVNGDGLADLLVGCPGIDQTLGTISSTGSVYVVFGRTDPQAIDLATIGAAGFPIVGPTDSLVTGLPLLTARPAVFGERLQSVPIDADSVTDDVNGDGLSDIVIGDSAVNSAAGSAYVIFGKTDSATVSANALGSGGFIISGARPAGLAGYSATIAGDLDGDTLADILVGEPGQTAATGGRAHIVSGSEATTAVDLAAPAGRAVTLSSGQPNDRFGVNVGALADTDRDGREDIAIATRSGAYVVRDIPTTSRQITADDGYAINGPTNDPGPLSTTVPATSIASAGDVNADRRADLIIGYPDAAGARAYIVHSPERTRTLDVANLPGQRGTGLNGGTQGARSGAAVGANADQADAAITDTAQAILGAPAASPSLRINAGSAYTLAARPAAPVGASLRAAAQGAAAQGAAAGCDYTNKTTAYPFDVGPSATFGYRVPVAADGYATYGTEKAILPECRITTKNRRDEVPRGFRKIGKDRAAAPFARNGDEDTTNTREEAVVDSKGRTIATLRQKLTGSGDKRSVSRWTVVLPGNDNALTVKQTRFSVQGYACYVQPTTDANDTVLQERRRYVMVALRPITGAPGPGVRGFIRRTAIKYTSDRALRRADTRCGNSRTLTQSSKAPLARSGVNTEKYQGSTSARNVCPTNYAQPGCGALMETYEPSNYPDTITLALSSTGVTGGDDAGVAGGGIAMAIVRTGDPFRTLDAIGYNDPNVPCASRPKVRWAYINANPDSTNRRIYAWFAIKVGDVPSQGTRTCPPDARQRP